MGKINSTGWKNVKFGGCFLINKYPFYNSPSLKFFKSRMDGSEQF